MLFAATRRHQKRNKIRTIILIESLNALKTPTGSVEALALSRGVQNKTLIPLMGPSVCAGFPSPADDYVEEALGSGLITYEPSTAHSGPSISAVTAIPATA